MRGTNELRVRAKELAERLLRAPSMGAVSIHDLRELSEIVSKLSEFLDERSQPDLD